MQSDRWIEKGGFRSETRSGILRQSKKFLFNPNLFDRAIGSAHPVEKVYFFNGMYGSDRLIENVLEAHRISHHPTRHTITPYNSSDAGLTATMLLLLLLLLLLLNSLGVARRVPRQPAARTVIRWQLCVLSTTFFLATRLLLLLLLLLCSLWRLSTKSNATTPTMKRMLAPRAPNERFARGKGGATTCV